MTRPRQSLDLPGILLASAVRRMPVDRRAWGAAMEAELAQLQQPFTRWRFALGCAGVALFPPRRSRLLQSVMNNSLKNLGSNPRAAAFIGFILALPIPLLLLIAVFEIPPFHGWIKPSFTEADGVRQKAFSLIVLVVGMLLLPAASYIALTPVLRSVRAGNRLSANPVNLTLGVVILLVFVWILGGLFIDQLPCFLGVPNCD